MTWAWKATTRSSSLRTSPQEFTVDLRLLGENWDYSFSPEGLGLVGKLPVVVPTLAIGNVIRLIFPTVAFWMAASLAFEAWMPFLAAAAAQSRTTNLPSGLDRPRKSGPRDKTVVPV
jgi:hypothetical protein